VTTLTSRLVRAEVAGRHLSEEELAQWFILLVVAGAETSRQAITHGVLMLDRHREQRRGSQQDFADLAGTAGGGDRALVRPGHRLSPHTEE
jgi:methyl-branched lipid omega-hydroxylase